MTETGYKQLFRGTGENVRFGRETERWEGQ